MPRAPANRRPPHYASTAKKRKVVLDKERIFADSDVAETMAQTKRIGILTAGGDSPGLNATFVVDFSPVQQLSRFCLPALVAVVQSKPVDARNS